MAAKKKIAKCKNSAKARPNCIVENSGLVQEIKERFWSFESARSIAEDMTKRGIEMHECAVHRWAKRTGEFDARARSTDHILDTIIERGLRHNIPVDSKTVVSAMKLRMQKHKEIESNVNVNIQIVKSPEQINERINDANRLLPMSN